MQTEEVKAAIIEDYLTTGSTYMELAERHGIHWTQIGHLLKSIKHNTNPEPLYQPGSINVFIMDNLKFYSGENAMNLKFHVNLAIAKLKSNV